MPLFKNDAFLWYNVPAWDKLGLAVPNFGNDQLGQNGTIRNLTQVVGRNLQAVMFHPDSWLRVPPSINTLIRMHTLIIRARSILSSRSVPANVPNMEPQHALPAAEEFLVFPTPYFTVRNSWLKEYCGLTLLALTEAFQHTENAKPLEISNAFAGVFGQYLVRIYRLMAVELLRVDVASLPKDAAGNPDWNSFTLSDSQLRAYNPAAWFTSTELIDTVPELDFIPTEDDLQPLTNGIAVSSLPTLGRWPTGASPFPATGAGTVGTSASNTAAAPAESFPPAPVA